MLKKRDQESNFTLHAWFRAIGIKIGARAAIKLEQDLDKIAEAQYQKRVAMGDGNAHTPAK